MQRRLVLVVISLAACSSSSSSRDWLPDDIDEQQTLDRIGDAAYVKLCGAFEDYVRDRYRSDRLLQAACTANALQTTTDAIACGAAVDECLDTLPPAVEAQLEQILAQARCDVLGLEPGGCTSKVSALTECLDALGAQLDQVELAATCAAFGSPVPEAWWNIDPPAACTAITSSC